MSDKSRFCATCGKERRPLEIQRENWSIDETAHIPSVEGQRPWQQLNDLILHVAVYRNGGTGDDCHLCDDCLRIGLRSIKLRIDAALEAIDVDRDKDAELARLIEQIALLQHQNQHVARSEKAGVPWYAWNYPNFLNAAVSLWRKIERQAIAEQNCRRCSECRNSSHHWMENGDFEDPSSIDPKASCSHICKHCETLGVECDHCQGSGTQDDEETNCIACAGEGVLAYLNSEATPCPN